jgi:hypothetical protein
MKYCIPFLLLMLVAAEGYSDPALLIGVNRNASTITGNDSLNISDDLRFGFGFSIGFEQNFFKYLSLIVGAGFESRGEKNVLSKILNKETNVRQETVQEIDMLSLQIPVLVQFNLPIHIFRFSVFGGPDMGIFLKGEKRNNKKVFVPEINGQPARVDELSPEEFNFMRDIKMLDLGITAGIGFEVNTGKVGAAFIRPAVYIGLIDILQSNHDKEENVNLNGKHQAFSVAVGYKFNIKPISRSQSDKSEYDDESSSSGSSDQSTDDLEGYRSYIP